MLWFVILVTISSSGQATATTHYPKTPSYNNESACMEYGKTLADKIQVEQGTKNAKVFWKCDSVSYETIAKSMQRV
jgi:hypothetical protein